ncbi:MAG: ATP-binding protein [Frankiaceae bacterium]|nr:ATP-binding protein [Frankiaceae bacterium]
MTVIRGEAARSLVARSHGRQVQRAQQRAGTAWAKSIVLAPSTGVADEGPRRARAFTRGQLASTSLAGRSDDAALIVTELVRNAQAAASSVRLRLCAFPPGLLLIEVFDDAPSTASLRVAAATASNRRDPSSLAGLDVVQHLADCWGVREEQAGKCVWARLGREAP